MSQIRFVEASIVDAFERGEEIVHCVSSDFAMGVGVARTLADINPSMRSFLRKEHPLPKTVKDFAPFTAVWSEGDKCIYNLVTKYLCFHKPTLDTLRTSIMTLGSILERKYKDDDIIKISMPMIATGCDKMHWCKVEKLLTELLSDKVVITVYVYNPRRKRIDLK